MFNHLWTGMRIHPVQSYLWGGLIGVTIYPPVAVHVAFEGTWWTQARRIRIWPTQRLIIDGWVTVSRFIPMPIIKKTKKTPELGDWFRKIWRIDGFLCILYIHICVCVYIVLIFVSPPWPHDLDWLLGKLTGNPSSPHFVNTEILVFLIFFA